MSGPAQPAAITPVEALACAVLRGLPAPWPGIAPQSTGGDPEHTQAPDDDLADRFLAAAAHHGVQPLLFHLARETPWWEEWPAAVRRALETAVFVAVAVERLRAEATARVVEAMAAADVRTMVIKGGALAHSHYPAPWLRSRCDLDLLVHPADRARAESALRALGCTTAPATGGSLVSYQRTWTLPGQLPAQLSESGHGAGLDVDLHWRVSNRQAFAAALPPEGLLERAVPLPALGARARTLAPPDALLVACAHSAGHRHEPFDPRYARWLGGDRLIWLLDIRLLLARMDDAECETFARRAADACLRAVCAESLARAQSLLGTTVPEVIRASLDAGAAGEIAAAYIGAGRIGLLRTDLRALPDWRARIRLLREHLLPPAEYMLARYRTANRALLPALYAHRLLRGALKGMRSAR